MNARDTSFVDTVAFAYSGPHAGDYFYMVAVRTRSGQLISGVTRFVQLPGPGQTELVLPVDATATLNSGYPDTVVDPSGFSLSVSPDIASRAAERAIFEFGPLNAFPSGAVVADARLNVIARNAFRPSPGASPAERLHTLLDGDTATIGLQIAVIAILLMVSLATSREIGKARAGGRLG